MTDLELYHYGVKGMKWGVRKKEIRTADANRRLGQLGTSRSANKMMLDAKNRAAEARYYGGRTKVKNSFVNRTLDRFDENSLKRAKARNQVDFQLSELSDQYNIARQKARKDKTYKKTAEYKAARNALGRSYVDRMMLGDQGYMNMQMEIAMGKDAKKARGKAYVMASIASAANWM